MPTKAEMKVQLDEVRAQRDSLKTELRRLTEAQDELTKKLEKTEGKLAAANENLTAVQDELEEVKAAAGSEVEEELAVARWEKEEADRMNELTLMRSIEEIRRESQQMHSKELEARDYLIELLKEKVAQLQAAASVTRREELSLSTDHSDESMRSEDPETEASRAAPGPSSRSVKLTSLGTFSGEDVEDAGAFTRWLRKLEKIAELHKWTDKELLLQFELLLTGRAERIYELLPEGVKVTFKGAAEALQKRLDPVKRDALRSAQLIRRRQQSGESVDAFAQDFERLFEQSYGCRTGMDEDSRNMLKRDLFVQGLLLKWQEKVLPSATTFTDALHQARTIEEQTRQLAKMHSSGGSTRQPPPRRKTPAEAVPPDGAGDKSGSSAVTKEPVTRLRCHKCNSPRHLFKDCPVRKPATEAPGRNSSSASSNIVTDQQPTEGTGDYCERLHRQWAEAEYQRLRRSFPVDTVTGPVGPLYYCQVLVAGQPVDAMIDSGSSATIMSFDLFKRVAKKAGLTADVLQKPDVVLRDYSQHPIRIGAVAQVEVEYRGKKVLTPIYLNAEHGTSTESCLLGTNVLFSLGLLSVADGVEARGGAEPPGHTQTSPVKLLRAERIPSHCGAVLRVTVDKKLSNDGTMYFQPARDSRVQVEESVVRVEDGQALVPVANYSNDVVKLDADYELGRVIHVRENGAELLVDLEEAEESMLPETIVSAVAAFPKLTESQRKEKLTTLLGKDVSSHASTVLESVLKYHQVFSLEEDERGCVHGTEHVIDTGEHSPIKQSPHRVPFALRGKITEMVQDMLEQGIVEESSSPWASPVVIVKKKDNSLRFCVDYRRLNAITRKDVFPLPRIDDLLDQLSGKQVFSTFDARRGYWQIPIQPESQSKTAFVTHEGLYEFRVMPFGLCNAPATFQRLMQKILSGLNHFCNVYIDDILVFSRNLEEHQKHLEEIFCRLEQHGLKLHPEKCQLARNEVEYLGHVVSADGIQPNPSKVAAVQCFPVPSSTRAVREFLGLCSYYRRFVPGFSKIASPLHRLLKADVKFEWTEECQKAFQHLKELLVTPPVLSYPDFSKPFVVHTDASGEGLGAVLEQVQDDGTSHPVAYASRTLSKHEKRYGITELEALGVVWSLKHFKAYLWGHQCIVYTDHCAVKSLLYNSRATGKLARWADAVAEFDLEIRYRQGRQNGNADALSRSPLPATEEDTSLDVTVVANITDHQSDVPEVEASSVVDQDFIHFQRSDPVLSPIITSLENNESPLDSKYVLIEGLLHYAGDKEGDQPRVCVPTEKKEELMKLHHKGTFAGHFSSRALYRSLSKRYWWKGMSRDATTYCRGCLTCTTYQGAGKRLKPPLLPIPVGGPFHRVGVDIMELPLTIHGNCYVVVFTDYLTKWVEAFPTSDQTSETIATLLVNEVICRHGVPELLLSDRGSNLLSHLMEDVCELTGIKKVNTTASHPQTDGLTEKFNRTLRAMIAKYSESYGANWDEYLPRLLFAYRTKVHESTLESPFFLLYGRDARIPSEDSLSFERSPYMVDTEDYKVELAATMSDAWKAASSNVTKAQERQKKQYDRKSRTKPVNPGDRVMVYMPRETSGKSRKLARPHFGPYRVLETHPNGVTVRPVDKPNDSPIRVNLDRISLCPAELANVSWLGKRRQTRK